MSSIEERQAASLFDRYLDAVLRGERPSPEAFLSQCPTSESAHLADAIRGSRFLLENYYRPRVKEDTVDATIREIQALRRTREAARRASERAVEMAGLCARDPKAYLSGLMGLPGEALGAGKASPADQGRFVVLNRGGAAAKAKNTRRIEKAQLRAIEKARAQEAERVLCRGMLTDAPVDVARVADVLGLYVEDAPLEGIDGCIVTDGSIGGILINRALIDPRRRRFTLAHEIGHFILHGDLGYLAEQVDEVENAFSSHREREANIFASYLLIPSFLFPRPLRGELPSLEQADHLAQEFQVSFAAALHRLVRESDWRCALVVTKDGVVQWAVPSQEFDAWIPTGSRPHPDTMAALLLRTGGPDEDGSRLPASAWVQGELADDGRELAEQSRRVGKGYVYTLLTVIEQD